MYCHFLPFSAKAEVRSGSPTARQILTSARPAPTVFAAEEAYAADVAKYQAQMLSSS